MKTRFLALVVLCLLAFSALHAQEPVATPLYRIKESMSGMVFSVGGKDYGPYHHTFGPPAFSPSYGSWILPAWTMADTGLFLVNGREVPLTMAIEHNDPFFISDDGAHYAILLVATPDKAPLRDYILADGKLLGPFAKADCRAENGSWYAFVEKKEKGPRYLLLGDKTWGPYDEFRESAVDPVSAETVFVVRTKDQHWLIHKGKELGPYSRVDFVRDRDGILLGYALYGKTGVELMIADKKYGPYDDLDSWGAWVSKDRASWMVRASRKGSAVLVRDGKESVYDWVDLYPRDTGYILFASLAGKAFFTDGTREWGPYWNVYDRYVPFSGAWAVSVEKKKGADWPVPMIVLPTGEYPGSRLRFDGATYSWLTVDDDGNGAVMRLPAK